MKGIASLRNADGSLLLLAAANSGSLQAFRYAMPGQQFYDPGSASEYAMVTFKNGRKMKQEFYWGNTYLSSSERLIWYNKESMTMIELYDAKGGRIKIIK